MGGGIAAITVYAPTIFSQAGYGARKSQWLSGLNDVSFSPVVHQTTTVELALPGDLLPLNPLRHLTPSTAGAAVLDCGGEP